MGQSLVRQYTHIVFSTKYRQPFLQPYIESKMHAYLAGACNDMGCRTIKVGGYVDHVHILCNLGKMVSLSQLLQRIKGHSSQWVKTQHRDLREFYWQNGYGAFSVSHSQVSKVVRYIENQHVHPCLTDL